MSRRARAGFVASLGVITVAAIVAAVLVDAPAKLPGIALGIPLVLRAEVAILLAAVGYAFLIAFTLGCYGRGFIKIGPSGVETGALVAVEQSNEALAGLRMRLDQLTQATMIANAEIAQELEQLRPQIPVNRGTQE